MATNAEPKIMPITATMPMVKTLEVQLMKYCLYHCSVVVHYHHYLHYHLQVVIHYLHLVVHCCHYYHSYPIGIVIYFYSRTE